MAGHTSYVRREPVGVCAAVTPWNYPMMMAVWKWAPAIAAGNTMVIKPSETTPVSTLLLAEILAEHLPPGSSMSSAETATRAGPGGQPDAGHGLDHRERAGRAWRWRPRPPPT